MNLSSTSAPRQPVRRTTRGQGGHQGLTKTLAHRLGRFNVTANAIAPGFIRPT